MIMHAYNKDREKNDISTGQNLTGIYSLKRKKQRERGERKRKIKRMRQRREKVRKCEKEIDGQKEMVAMI